MSKLLALDVAILPTPAVRARALELSAALPAAESHGLRLDDDHLPHLTLAQLFVRVEERELAFEKIGGALRGQRPLRLVVTGGGRANDAVFMTVEKTPELQKLHERLMEALRGVERPGGMPPAFFDGDARMGDVLFVATYRVKSSFAGFEPHITLGHAQRPPAIERMPFQASIVAACHLGRFCACRAVMRTWML